MGEFRPRRPFYWALLTIAWFALSSFPAQAAQDAKTQTTATPDFEKQIAPLLQQSCGKCHSGAVSMGKLRLDSETAILRGGASGPAIVPGASGSSLLMKRVLGVTDAPRMPMGWRPPQRGQRKDASRLD